MVKALDSGSSGPGVSTGRDHCVVFLGKTLESASVSLYLAGCISGYWRISYRA